jgi:hypothetical protein
MVLTSVAISIEDYHRLEQESQREFTCFANFYVYR